MPHHPWACGPVLHGAVEHPRVAVVLREHGARKALAALLLVQGISTAATHPVSAFHFTTKNCQLLTGYSGAAPQRRYLYFNKRWGNFSLSPQSIDVKLAIDFPTVSATF
jgi:hypothetical protein